MQRALVSQIAGFTIALFSIIPNCASGADGLRPVPETNSNITQREDVDPLPRQAEYLSGMMLKPVVELSQKAVVNHHQSTLHVPLGVRRRVPQEYPTIQAGINASVHGDTVLVSEGTYFENIKYRGKRIVVASLYLMDQDTSHISRTIIDGSLAVGDTGSVVCFVAGEDTNSVLCGFTIRGGFGTWIPTWQEADGGGVFLWQSGARLVRNIITGNHVLAPNAWGGGVSAASLAFLNQVLIMEDNIVIGNSVTADGSAAGGGVAIYATSYRLTGNVIESDSCTGLRLSQAAGIMVSPNSFSQSGIVQGNVIRRNSVRSDTVANAVVVLTGTASISVDNNVFEDNVVTATYGSANSSALQVVGGSTPVKTITRNIFQRNRATSQYDNAYGAVTLYATVATFGENLLKANRAEAAIRSWGGGITLANWSGVFENNILTGNNIVSEFHSLGGGITHVGSAPPSGVGVIVNNTICGNRAQYGGGVYTSVPAVLLNNIFWDDSSSTGEMYVTAATIEVHYSNIQGGWSGGTGNIDIDPMFMDSSYHISSASPCNNTGIDSLQIAGVWYRAPQGDFAGNPRPMPVGSQPDMGAWESGMAVQPQWQLQATINGTPNFTGVKAVTDQIAWISGFDSVYRTTNGGEEWTSTPASPATVEIPGCIEALNANTAFVGGVGPGGGAGASIYRTTNGGQSWDMVYTGGTSSYWNEIHFFNEQNGIAFGDPSSPPNQFLIVKSTDGGATWAPIANRPVANPGEAGIWHSFHFFDSMNGWFGTSSGRVFRTTDGGNNWVGYSAGNIDPVWGVRFVSPMVGIRISASQPFISRSTDGGQTWTGVNNLVVSGIDFSVTSISTPNRSQLWVAGQASTPFILTSTDSGTTWHEQTLPVLQSGETPFLSAVTFGALNDSVQAFGAVVYGGTILSYRQSIGTVTSVTEATSLPEQHKLFQNYPNPFNPSTKIGFEVVGSGLVSLKIYDVLAREIATLVNEVKQPGSYEVTWDAGGMASGVYFYRLTSGSFSETKRLVVLR